YAINLTCLGLDGLPETKGLVDILRARGDFRVATIRARTTFSLERVQGRHSIVLVCSPSYAQLEYVTKLERTSEEHAIAKETVQEKDEDRVRQSYDNVDLRLGKRTKLDGIKHKDERKNLEGERKTVKALLDDEKELRSFVVSELKEDAKKFGDE